jgi:predicted nucleic acid-binding protein
MEIVVDTSAYSNFYRDADVLDGYFVATNILHIPILVIGELKAGFSLGSKRLENESNLQRFLDMPNVAIMNISLDTTSRFGNLYAELRRLGIPIGTNDMWIAALALEHNLPLLTCDTDFSRVPDLLLA